MEIIRQTHIDFLGKRFICLALSAILLAVCLWSLASGINRGIDFAGGTEIQVKFAEPPPVDELRNHLNGLGLGDVSLQRIGPLEEGEFLIRVGSQEDPGTASAQELPEASGSGEGEAAAGQAQDPAAGEAPAGDEDGAASGEETPPAQDEAAAAPENAAPAPAPAVEAGGGDSEQDRVYQAVLSALRDLTDTTHEPGSLDLNIAGTQEIAGVLAARPGGAADALALARSISDYRTDHAGLFHRYDELDQVAGVTPEVREYLEESSYLGPFTIRRVEFVGPRVGSELARKAYLAMAFALAGMLVYITVRFRRFGFALGGIVALMHDGLIAAGVFNLWGGQFDLTIVAALLTLLGYSINDTIVIFDRVRENQRAMRGSETVAIFNASINQTLSRTLLTSLTTLLVVFCLYFFGGETIHGFAFLLMFGIFIGTYSTIFIASPVAIAYMGWMEGRRAAARSQAAAPAASGRGRRKKSAGGR